MSGEVSKQNCAKQDCTTQERAKQDFAKQVCAITKLYEFTASERRSYHVPDKIIDEIEVARQIVMDGGKPSPEQRASLSKAHRDLIMVPDMSITYSGVPPLEFWGQRSPWTWSIGILSAAPTVVLLLLMYVNRAKGAFDWHLPLIYAAMSALSIWVLFVFTGVVTDRKLSRLIGTCYAFTLGAVVLSLAPFMFEGDYLSKPEAEINVLRGCAAGSDGTIPEQVKCATAPADRSQWVVNIGGLAMLQPSRPSVPAATPQSATPLAPTSQSATPQSATPAPPKLYTISGGLVVPLYVIVLALIGSAISMTRRVPEYQRRAMSAQDPLSNVEAREKLVFQVMQVVSAPLIAVTAFSIVKPGSVSEAVIVGFGSGFASEPILLMIRGLVEKISPAPSAASGSVAVKITPPTATLKPGETATFNAQVIGVSNNAVTWHLEPDDPASGTISKSGLYTAPATVAAEKNVTATAVSAADLNKSGSAAIKLVPASTAAAPPAPTALAEPPVAVTMKPNEKRRFTATVAGDPAAPVTWVLQPAGAASGTLVDGTYTAPPTPPPGTVAVIAQKADATRIGSAQVTIAA
jgi:hypothetical protein